MLLYIHYPFCRSKCAYCAFFSREREEELEDIYFSALLGEVAYWGDRLGRPRVSTLYIGGGTPSLMSLGQLERLAEQIERCFALDPDLECTLEANPDSLDRPERVRALADMGVSRISLGLQSLDRSQLRLLQRPHSAEQGLRAVEAVRAGGIGNLGLDLLWGLPGQTPENWLGQLERVVALEPEHISCYCLTLEQGTRLADRAERGELEPPGEERLEAMFLQGSDLLRERGYTHYEIANFARPGYACRHNLGYWEGLEYLGLGPSAVSTISMKRWTHPSDIVRYAECVHEGTPDRHAEDLTRGQRLRELVLLGLRTSGGLDLQRYRDWAGTDLFREKAGELQALQERELIRLSRGRLRLTTHGMLLCDAITGALMPEDA
jgi:oxygen-independent coproporphyrinogen-3 oxidase